MLIMGSILSLCLNFLSQNICASYKTFETEDPSKEQEDSNAGMSLLYKYCLATVLATVFEKAIKIDF